MKIDSFKRKDVQTAKNSIEGVEFNANGYHVNIYKTDDIYTVRYLPLRRVIQPDILYHKDGSLMDFPRGNITSKDLDEFIKNVRDAAELASYVENNIDELINRKE